MAYKAEIPYGAYWSTPFARWQGAFASRASRKSKGNKFPWINPPWPTC